jgi:hypothetical protein
LAHSRPSNSVVITLSVRIRLKLTAKVNELSNETDVSDVIYTAGAMR